ncbi:MFS transporter [Schumannella soli]|uniref:MFS transporter n=2 Tax=Schumannella soli TaxID=2590779 RepID=A0A506XV43_9MICO|nr:MFS transporter [Schumannella soli]TPW76581.1 MFS transporter [Schumannella soli]
MAPHLRATTIGSFALVFLGAFEALAVTTVMPAVSADLDGAAYYALAFSGTLAASVVGVVVAGRWSDRRGPVAPLLAATAIFLVGLIVAGSASTIEVFVVGRLLQGFGSGAINVALYVVVARLYPAVLHPRIFGAFAAAWVLPSMIGPPVAGWVAEQISWHWVFLGVAVLVLIAAALMLPAIRQITGSGAAAAGTAPAATEPAESAERSGPATSIASAESAEAPESSESAESAGATGSAAQAQPEQTGPGSLVSILLALVVAGAVLAISLAQQLPSPLDWTVAVVALIVAGVAARPLLPRRTLLAGRGLPATVLLRGLVAASFFAAEIYMPLMLHERDGLALSVSGLILTVGAISWAAGSHLQGRLGERFGSTAIARVGTALIAVGIVVQLLDALLALGPIVAAAGWLVAGAGMGTVFPRVATLALAYSTPRNQGFNSAALSIFDAASSATSIAIAGLLFALVGGTDSPFAYAAAFALSVVVIVLAQPVAARTAPPGAQR